MSYMGSKEHVRDRSDTLRFIDDALERRELTPDVALIAKQLLRGPRAFRPQAVTQALVSFVVNERDRSSSNSTSYFVEMVEEQQERLYGKPRKQ